MRHQIRSRRLLERLIRVTAPVNKLEADRLANLQALVDLGVDPWGGRYDDRTPIAEVRQRAVPDDPLSGPVVKIAGRVMSFRGMGRIRFFDLADQTARMQVMAGQKQVDELSWQVLERVDLGDLVAVSGRFGKTKAGELTIFAESVTFQAKSLLPHPDKWGGIEDAEFALRHRYLDLIYDQELRAKALLRPKILQAIRSYLTARGYLEVETPVLHSIAGGAAARPFTTHHNALDIDLFLRIALELPLKRLLVAGFEKVYEVSRVFRNEGISPRHNPEFTMLELYEAYGNYHTMMDLTEGLIVHCVEQMGRGLQLPFSEVTLDFTPPWQRRSYSDLLQEHAGVAMDDVPGVAAKAAALGLATAGKAHEVLVHHLFESQVEPHLIGPVFVYDYPAALCPLTKRKREKPEIAERFELYMNRMELANAYTELNDPITQEQTFRQQLAGLPEEESMAKMDDDFVKALKYGMPPAGGLGIGIDRLVMLLTNSQTIRDVILFPLLRPERG